MDAVTASARENFVLLAVGAVGRRLGLLLRVPEPHVMGQPRECWESGPLDELLSSGDRNPQGIHIGGVYIVSPLGCDTTGVRKYSSVQLRNICPVTILLGRTGENS